MVDRATQRNGRTAVHTATQELAHGISSMYGKEPNFSTAETDDDKASPPVIVGNIRTYAENSGHIEDLPELVEDGYYLCVFVPRAAGSGNGLGHLVRI
ncbi:hypothetical protein BDW59DRAFT_167408 [Aspergillus cavernicola]|uniref:Alpha glucuronidase N-terminal domain-containing protein n=1 Tax=Aspergillus cavernicola TaxID=176166 RepID=A0ABR4HE59_9EURO